MNKYCALLLLTSSILSASQPRRFSPEHTPFYTQKEYSLLDEFPDIVIKTLQSHLKSPDTKAVKKSLLDIMTSIDDAGEQLLVIITLESPKAKTRKHIQTICQNNRAGRLFLESTITQNITAANFPSKEPFTYSFIVAK
jgi:hypothetical protein